MNPKNADFIIVFILVMQHLKAHFNYFQISKKCINFHGVRHRRNGESFQQSSRTDIKTVDKPQLIITYVVDSCEENLFAIMGLE